MARRSSKRNMTVELVERGDLLNLRVIGEAMAQAMRQQQRNSERR